MEHGEIAPCDPEEPEACEDVCAELHARFQADAMKRKPFVVRSARCSEYEAHPDYVTTECSEAVIEIDGFCYDASRYPFDWNNWQSCELDDQQILSAPRPILPDCDDIPDSVPATADCRPACDDASTCRHAQGCDYGPSGSGYGRSGRGYCYACSDDDECLSNERCVRANCVLPENDVECESDDDCAAGQGCARVGLSPEGRGNQTLELRCVSE